MVLDRHQTDLYVRPSWLDAAVALRQIEKVGESEPLLTYKLKIPLVALHK